MSAESPIWGAHAPRVPSLAPRQRLSLVNEESCFGEAPKSEPDGLGTPAACAPPKLNNRNGPASDESIQAEGVKTGCVDTIVNDVRFFLHKYENGESDRWN